MGVISWLYICILVFLVFIYRHITRNFNYWMIQNVPYVPPVLLFGNFFKGAILKQSIGEFVSDIYNFTDSRFTGFFVFDQPFLLIREPKLIKNILVKDFDHFDNRSVNENRRDDEINSNILFVLKNPAWRLLRTTVTPVFTTGKIKGMLPLMLEVSEDLKTYINEKMLTNGGVLESREMTMKYTTDVISSCAFGINSQFLKYDNAEFGTCARRFFTFTYSRGIQIASFFLAPWLVRLFRMKFMEPNASQFMRSVFWKHMEDRKQSNVKRGDLIDILIRMENADNTSLDKEVLVAQGLQFFLAGLETTLNAISFTLYALALNKDVQNRLREEIRETFAGQTEISYEAVVNMKYLDNVLCESFRIYPTFTFLDRRCTKAYKIPNSSITIQEGLPIYISLLGLHMDPKYFPEPDKFNPNRFSEKNKNSILAYTYMPFGEGPRNCIGERFGLLVTKIALITILSDFEVEAHSSTPVPLKLEPKSGFLTSPYGGILHLLYRRCK